jgi:hypothetical protein
VLEPSIFIVPADAMLAAPTKPINMPSTVKAIMSAKLNLNISISPFIPSLITRTPRHHPA